ncbi:hypothetical protein PMM47T1_22233 [Pseudomonas sp. M47T1]|nr:hypothetical protein PMM47T1_22233 [Pseudomonas sp. M47T1]
MLSLLVLSTAAGASDDRDEAMFVKWFQHHHTVRFEHFLVQRKIDAVVPLYQLLRTASDWRECHAQPFALPPASHWPAVESTLKLLDALRQQGVLTRFEVVSAYRDKRLNACAGGAAHSAHAQAFAVDLEFPEGSVGPQRLCDFWKQHGGEWNLGLSRYPSGRVHLDTTGYRTWGEDYSARTSYCLQPAPDQVRF